MENVWFASALWIGLALIASVAQRWIAVSIALLEIIVGAVAGNVVDLTLTPWVNYLAGFGAILLTFLAGAEIDVNVIRRNFGSTMSIGAVGFCAVSGRAGLCPFCVGLAMATGTDCWHCALNDFSHRRLRGHGRNRVQ
jgi:Kef-type K+ transport system membrane component KefB